MISCKKDYKEYITYEQKKYGINNNFINTIKKFAGSEQAIIWCFQKRLRKTEYYYNCKHRVRYIFSLIILNYKRNKYGLHISTNTFEKGLKIMHLGSILTNGEVRVGKDCSIHINTALVAQGNGKEVPVLGDNIIIGVGATIVGGINIGNGIAIGANSLVNKNFLEENITIGGGASKKNIKQRLYIMEIRNSNLGKK